MRTMLEISINIQTINHAFDENPAREAARILHEIADQLDATGDAHHPKDINGNTVGRVTIIRGGA